MEFCSFHYFGDDVLLPLGQGSDSSPANATLRFGKGKRPSLRDRAKQRNFVKRVASSATSADTAANDQTGSEAVQFVDPSYFSDLVHFNEHGYDRLAKRIRNLIDYRRATDHP